MSNFHITGNLTVDGRGRINGYGILHETKTVFSGSQSSGTISYSEPINIPDWRFVLIEGKVKHQNSPIVSTLVVYPAVNTRIYIGANGPSNQYEAQVVITNTSAKIELPSRITINRITYIR